MLVIYTIHLILFILVYSSHLLIICLKFYLKYIYFSVEDLDYDVFPVISHVQQIPNLTTNGINFWDLQKPTLNLKPLEFDIPKVESFETGSIMKIHSETSIINNCRNINMVVDIPKTIEQLKTLNPEYPVYKSFKSLRQKCNYNDNIKSGKTKSPKKLKKKKKNNNSIEIVESQTNHIFNSVWTEKYKPTTSNDVIGNLKNVLKLKKWLQTWVEYSTRRRCRSNSSSSEFESGDCDSKSSTSLPTNAIILSGPHGSGKSCSVYAIATELGFNVIELNASSRRTGLYIIFFCFRNLKEILAYSVHFTLFLSKSLLFSASVL